MGTVVFRSATSGLYIYSFMNFYLAQVVFTVTSLDYSCSIVWLFFLFRIDFFLLNQSDSNSSADDLFVMINDTIVNSN